MTAGQTYNMVHVYMLQTDLHTRAQCMSSLTLHTYKPNQACASIAWQPSSASFAPGKGVGAEQPA